MSADEPILVDARGHRCPTPTLRLSRALRSARPGQCLCLLADDPMARIDVPHFVAHNDLVLVETTDEGGWLRFLVRKDGA